MEHVVIQDPRQTFGQISSLDILCRCRSTKHPPYEKVSIGDTVFIQKKGGPIVAKATVSSVVSKRYDVVDEIRELCRSTSLYNASQYWLAQEGRHYGTVVWLTDHVAVSPPIYRKYCAIGNVNDWIILDTEKKRQEWPGL